MSAQPSLSPRPPTAHPHARLIETLYGAIRKGDPDAIIACYADDACFEDIAFQRRGKPRILEMWRLVCHGRPQVTIDFDSISADARKGNGRWMATYMFGRSATKAGRKVDNTLTSEFAFRDGLIVDHRDRCHAMAWAVQAIPFPVSLLVGSLAPLRRALAARRLKKFLNK
jgi:ketosteroid isomerase-like protein